MAGLTPGTGPGANQISFLHTKMWGFCGHFLPAPFKNTSRTGDILNEEGCGIQKMNRKKVRD